MSWKGFFEGIQSFFEEVAFAPYNMLRTWELENWWGANIFSWMFVVIGFVAFVYWMRKLKEFNNDEDRSQQAHSFLG